MNWDYLGFIAGFMTTVGFIPQIVKSYRSKHVSDVSVVQPLILFVGMGLWLVYGILKADWSIIVANVASMSFNLILVILKFKYRHSPS